MSYCSNCGAEIAEGTAFCPNCGAGQVRTVDAQEAQVIVPVYQPVETVEQPYVEQPYVETAAKLPRGAKIMSIISMACGLYSLVGGGILVAIAAVILSSIAGNKAPGVPNTMAKVGKITGIIGIPLSVIYIIIIYLVYFSALFGLGMSSVDSYYC